MLFDRSAVGNRYAYDYGAMVAVSDDGTAFVGQLRSEEPFFPLPVYWSETTGPVVLDQYVAPPYGSALAFDLSGDGQTIGIQTSYQLSPNGDFLWSPTGGYSPISTTPYAVNFDGTRIASRDVYAPSSVYAQIVENQSTFTPIGPGIPRDMTSDGKWVLMSTGQNLYLWSEGTGATAIPLPDGIGGFYPTTSFLSDDGNTIVAGCDGQQICLWRRDHGSALLSDVLANEYGLSVDPSTLSDPLGISADGRVIAGAKGSAGGPEISWVVVLVPEPLSSTFVALAAGIVSMTIRRRR
jgi:hypothetical protein